MKREEFINLISFCILMENGGGILDKAPRYVEEKFSTREPGLLDSFNTAKLEKYKKLWHVEDWEE